MIDEKESKTISGEDEGGDHFRLESQKRPLWNITFKLRAKGNKDFCVCKIDEKLHRKKGSVCVEALRKEPIGETEGQMSLEHGRGRGAWDEVAAEKQESRLCRSSGFSKVKWDSIKGF